MAGSVTRIVAAAALSLALGGCLAQAAVDVVTMPVRVAGKTVDVLTTSQSEADRNRGRRMRKEEARQRREQRKEAREIRREQRDEAREAAGGGG